MDGMKVFTLSEIGYGSGDGFRGWNCRHDWYPYFPGLSTPNYSKKELEDLNAKNIEWNGKKYTEYEISQMQRAQERKIRELKRQTVKMQDAADFTENPELKAAAQADYQAIAAKLKAAEKDLQTFCKDTGQDRDRFREQVYGFSRSEAQRAVQAAKKAKDLTVIWESGKIDVEKFKKSLSNGYVKTKIEPNKQIKHTYNKQWKNQVKQAVKSWSNPDSKKWKTPKSVLRKDIDPQKIVDEYGGTGRMVSSTSGDCVNEFINLPFVVGKTFDKKKWKYVNTNAVQIKYSPNGAHVLPTVQKEV